MGKSVNTHPSRTVRAKRSQTPKPGRKFTDEERLLVEMFLTRLAISARKAQKFAAEMVGISPENPQNPETLAYWTHVISGLRWAAYQAQHRQTQLDPAAWAAMTSEDAE